MVEKNPKTDEMGKHIYPFEMGYLPEFFQRKAEVELNDTPENRRKCLRVLKELIAKDEYFDGLNQDDDDFFLQFLTCRKFNIKKAFAQVKTCASLRKNHKELFSDCYFERIVITAKKKVVTFLPYRCQDGCAILHIKLDNWDPEEFPVEDVKRMVIILLLQSLRDPMTQVNGIKVIFDFKGNPIRHIKHVTPSNIYLIYHGCWECAPCRFKGIHFINKSLTMKIGVAIAKLFMTLKLKKRMFFHDSPQELLKYFPASALPAEYGGELNNYDMTDWLRDVMSPQKLATLAGGNYAG